MTGTAHTPLPCPFCGGEAKTISPLGFGNVRAIECCNSDDCAATGPWACDEAEALTAWNTRAVNSHHDLIEALRAATDALERLYLKAVVGTDSERHAALEGAFTAMENGRAILTKAEAGHG